MYFDRLCKNYESHRAILPDRLDGWLRDTKLFTLPKRVEDLEIDYSHSEEIAESFFLPFPSVAIEDPEGVVLLSETRPDQRGFGTPFAFSVFQDAAVMGAPPDMFAWLAVGTTTPKRFMPCASNRNGWLIEYELTIDTLYRLIEGDVCEVIDGASVGHVPQHDVLTHTATAIEEIIYFNQPDHFVLEKTNTKSRPPKEYTGVIARSHQRPAYTLIRPNEARAVMGLADPASGGPQRRCPHERRCHRRRLTSERYTVMRGKSIVIEATWIGPMESVVGNKRYRILTGV